MKTYLIMDGAYEDTRPIAVIVFTGGADEENWSLKELRRQFIQEQYDMI